MAKTKFITLSLFGFFMAAESNATNEIPSPLGQQENVTNINDCPETLDYFAFMRAYEGSSKTVTPFGAQFEFDLYTVQISSNSMKLLEDLKKLGNSEIYLKRNDQIQRGRCVYTPLSTKGTAINGPSFGLSIKIDSQISQKTRDMTPEEENAQKMMIFNEALKHHADSLKKEGEGQKDITKNVGTTLHAVSHNPALDATLEYTNPQTNEKISFKIGAKIKDGMIDLDKTKNIESSHLLITTDPSVFFTDQREMIVVLIAPWSLIHDNLTGAAAPFQPIMSEWDKTNAPIGIFWREGSDANKDKYDYQINLSIAQISEASMYEIYKRSKSKGRYKIAMASRVQTTWSFLYIKF